MEKKMQITIKTFVFFIQFALLFMFLNNIYKFILMDKEIFKLTSFVIENLFLLFIFILNIKSLILLKSENEKRKNTCLIYTAILAVIYFMNNIVMYNYIEVYLFYAISVIYMLYLLFKMCLVGEKYSTYKFETTKINKILFVLGLILVVVGQFIYIHNIKGEVIKLNSVAINKLLIKENVKVIAIFLFILQMIATEFLLKNINGNSKFRAFNGLAFLVISVFSVKRSILNCIGQIIITKYFLNNYFEVKKKRN